MSAATSSFLHKSHYLLLPQERVHTPARGASSSTHRHGPSCGLRVQGGSSPARLPRLEAAGTPVLHAVVGHGPLDAEPLRHLPPDGGRQAPGLRLRGAAAGGETPRAGSVSLSSSALASAARTKPNLLTPLLCGALFCSVHPLSSIYRRPSIRNKHAYGHASSGAPPCVFSCIGRSRFAAGTGSSSPCKCCRRKRWRRPTL